MSATTNSIIVTVTELKNKGDIRPFYGVLTIQANSTIKDYYLTLKEKSLSKPTATEIKNGFYYQRNLSTTPINIFAFGSIDLDKTVPSTLIPIDEDGDRSADQITKMKSLMLKPSSTYKVYGLPNNGNDADVKELTEFSTTAIIIDTKRIWGDSTLLSTANSDRSIIPLTLRENELVMWSGTIVDTIVSGHLFSNTFYSKEIQFIWFHSTGIYNLNADVKFNHPTVILSASDEGGMKNSVTHYFVQATANKAFIEDLFSDISWKTITNTSGPNKCPSSNANCIVKGFKFVVEG